MESNRSEECVIATDQSSTDDAAVYTRAECVCGFYECHSLNNTEIY